MLMQYCSDSLRAVLNCVTRSVEFGIRDHLIDICLRRTATHILVYVFYFGSEAGSKVKQKEEIRFLMPRRLLIRR